MALFYSLCNCSIIVKQHPIQPSLNSSTSSSFTIHLRIQVPVVAYKRGSCESSIKRYVNVIFSLVSNIYN